MSDINTDLDTNTYIQLKNNYKLQTRSHYNMEDLDSIYKSAKGWGQNCLKSGKIGELGAFQDII